MSRETITTLLDLAGLLLVAVGLGLLAAGAVLGSVFAAAGVGAVVTGLALLGGSRVIDWCSHPERSPALWRRMWRGDRR